MSDRIKNIMLCEAGDEVHAENSILVGTVGIISLRSGYTDRDELVSKHDRLCLFVPTP